MDTKFKSNLKRLADDLPYFARTCLKIRTESGRIEPFIFNKPQEYLHAALEKQKKETGQVRAIVLKGRQQGCSTYIAARFYHRAVFRTGIQVYILAHELDASANLFAIVNRYQLNNPVKHNTTKSNVKELIFEGVDSGYKVASAGTKGTGRSATIQCLHASEVGFWPEAQDHTSGIFQAVPDEDGTELILESTANGFGNLFQKMSSNAVKGKGTYQLVFIPWYWSDKYSKASPENFKLDQEEIVYKKMWDLTDSQIYWRRLKRIELGRDWLFKQEYPASAAEAFQSSGTDSFITPQLVNNAIAQDKFAHGGALTIGVDPARFGDDRTAIVHRVGREVTNIKCFKKKDTMEVVGIIIEEINRYKCQHVFIDVIGIGSGIVDRLRELKYGHIIKAVNAAEKPINPEKFSNRRAEMWSNMREWLNDTPVRLPNDDDLVADITTVRYSFDSNGRLKLERKEDMKKRGIPSPDIGDALALTFAFPVASADIQRRFHTRVIQSDTSWSPFATTRR